VRLLVRSQQRFYHASLAPITVGTLPPTGYYEKVDEGGCPEAVYTFDWFDGFRESEIKESSFSKAPEDAVGAVLKDCPFANTVRGWAPVADSCPVWVYQTDAQPDIDISDCGFDFGINSEVRYRRPVPISEFAHIDVPMEVYGKAGKALIRWTSDETNNIDFEGYERALRPVKSDVSRLLRGEPVLNRSLRLPKGQMQLG